MTTHRHGALLGQGPGGGRAGDAWHEVVLATHDHAARELFIEAEMLAESDQSDGDHSFGKRFFEARPLLQRRAGARTGEVRGTRIVFFRDI